MIILDTNVISELMRKDAEPAVISWVDQHSFAELCITSVTVAELLFGVARLPAGRRATDVRTALAHLLEGDFAGHILPFDESAAVAFAALAARRERAGRRVGMADTMIAAIAEVSGAQVLATRNTADFDGIDGAVDVVDPWPA